MTLPELLDLRTEDIEQMSDDQILKVLDPYFPLLRMPDIKNPSEVDQLVQSVLLKALNSPSQ